MYVAATVAYVVLSGGMAAGSTALGLPMTTLPLWQVALANAVGITLVYGAAGLAGVALCRRLALPGVLRRGAGPRAAVLRPMALGGGVGLAVVLVDRVSALAPGFDGFQHPPFPGSLLAAVTAGVGEELLFRLFVLSLWAALLSAFVRWLGHPGWRAAALGVANALAALAFVAGHLGTATVLAGARDPLALPPLMLLDLLVLNGLLGWVAGRAFLRDGVVAAAGVHLWADVAWHVLFPLIALH